jgi:hypothetical protein
MSTQPRTHSEDAQIGAEILKAAAEPRQSASVQEALEKEKTHVPVAPQTLGRNKGEKPKPLSGLPIP